MKLHIAISLILASSAQALNSQDACYSELGSSMRSHGTYSYQSPGHCMDKCRDEGFNYAAIQNLKCYCGAGKPSDDKKVSSDECDKPCAGWPDDICGGKNAWSLYTADNVLEQPPTAEPSSTSEKASSSTLESQSDSESTTASGVSASASVSSPVKSTTTSSNGSLRTGSASTTSSSPGAPGSSSSTAVTPTSSTSGANRQHRLFFWAV